MDQRIFGSMAIDRAASRAGDRPERARADAGGAHRPRPAGPAFDDAAVPAPRSLRSAPVKRALLDQTLVCGIGNIYADEALWAAQLHYDQPTERLCRARARLLLAEVRLVLEQALAEGGTSFDAQYVNVNGQSGYFSHSLNAYGRQGSRARAAGARSCARSS